MRVELLAKILLLFALLNGEAQAAWTAPVAFDDFGAEVPQLDTSHPGIDAIGFVHSSTIGGYFFFSVQQVGAAKQVVMTRFQEDGSIDLFWAGDPYKGLGSKIIGIPVPDRSSSLDESVFQARITNDVDGSPASEKIYIAAKYTSGGIAYLYVASFSTAGSLLGYSASNLSTSYSNGVGSVVDISTKTTRTAAGAPGVAVLVHGNGSEASKASIVQAYGNPVVIDIGELLAVSRPALRLNRFLARPDGLAEAVGTEAGRSVYMKFDVHGLALRNESLFDLSCPSGTPLSSVADNLVVTPPTNSEADVLVAGRAECMDAQYSEVARISNISSVPAVQKFSAQLQNRALCSPPFSSSGCVLSFLRTSDTAPYEILATTTLTSLAHFNLAGSLSFLGNDWNSLNPSYYPTALPLENYGTYYTYPYLVVVDGRVSGTIGLAKIKLDRIFADGSETVN